MIFSCRLVNDLDAFVHAGPDETVVVHVVDENGDEEQSLMRKGDLLSLTHVPMDEYAVRK